MSGLDKMLESFGNARTPNARLIKLLIFEFEHHINSGVYAYVSKMMAYNSNKIEGSRLTEDQTHMLFETRSICNSDVYYAHDVEEMTGHFLMFNYMLRTLDTWLTSSVIKDYHKYLKQGVFEDIANGYAIGDWKTRPNIIANYKTTAPCDVELEMINLLNWYHETDQSLTDILELHYQFEQIHPFQDGNGRVGRMLMFRELLLSKEMPFIIRDENKAKYYDALNNARNGNFSIFTDYAKEEQDWFAKNVMTLA
jgi:Fic family protein